MNDRTMPLAGSYAAAVQNPAYCFTDPVLRESAIKKNALGQPRAMSGQFAVVFPLTSPDGRRHAVKCFTHDAPNQLRRYELIDGGLNRLRPGWATDFVFQPRGIKVEGESFPILRMDWVEGRTLASWLDSRVSHPAAISRLAGAFDGLVRELSAAGIAHGDLQHGNILVTPEGWLRLVDYDGMYLPGLGLEDYPSHETGLPDYQHPARTAADYGPDMDRFSARLISLSLRALAADPRLLDSLNPARGEYLLLDREDFADPWHSVRLAYLGAHPGQRARDLAAGVRTMLALPSTAIPAPGSPLPDVVLPPAPPRMPSPSRPPKRKREPSAASPSAASWPRAGASANHPANPSWLTSVRAAQARQASNPAPVQPAPGPRPSAARRPRRLSSASARQRRTAVPGLLAAAGMAVLGLVHVVTSGSGAPAPAVSGAPAPAIAMPAPATSAPSASGPLTRLPAGTDILLADGRVLDVGDDASFTLVDASGHHVWSDDSRGTSLPQERSPYLVPQLSDGCVVVPGISDTTVVVSAKGSDYRTYTEYGGVIVNGSMAVWTDGTLANPCTRQSFDKATGPTPNSPPECLAGSAVVWQLGTYPSPAGVQAWQNGTERWGRTGAYNAVCDSEGTVALLDNATSTVDLVDLRSGKPSWRAPASACLPSARVECLTGVPDPVRMFEAAGTVILSADGVTLAFDKKTGKPLWQAPSACVLAQRTSPRPEALLGACTGVVDTNSDRARVVDPANGSTIKTVSVGHYYDQWTANSQTLLVADTSAGTFRELPW